MKIRELEIETLSYKNYEALVVYSKLQNCNSEVFQDEAAKVILEAQEHINYLNNSSYVAALVYNEIENCLMLTGISQFEINKLKLWGVYDINNIRVLFIFNKDF